MGTPSVPGIDMPTRSRSWAHTVSHLLVSTTLPLILVVSGSAAAGQAAPHDTRIAHGAAHEASQHFEPRSHHVARHTNQAEQRVYPADYATIARRVIEAVKASWSDQMDEYLPGGGHERLVFVRHGGVTPFVVSLGGGSEAVYTGKHWCVLQKPGIWSCTTAYPDDYGWYQIANNPLIIYGPQGQMPGGWAIQAHLLPGRKSMHGQTSIGVKLTIIRHGRSGGYVILWLRQATWLPVELDEGKQVQIWSRWNDRTLSIPAVPAA